MDLHEAAGRLQAFALGLLISSGGVATVRAAEPASTPLTPQQELSSFRLADANLQVELVAAEPDVVSPVAIAWDADGRMFVAEMTDYPTGPVSGRIRLLDERDADGHYRRATVFAENLPFPNGVLPWNGGVLVTAAPHIWFLKDTNGDGRADEKRILLTGFGEGNQQLRANGLFWGLDGWVYGANGRSDGNIRLPDDPPSKAISIRKRDFRFRPETGQFEAIAGQSQFGTARDDWGNRFLSWNTTPIRHEVLPQRYLIRNPQLGTNESVADIVPPGDTGQVFPISPAPRVFNDEPAGYFNALAGLTIFRGEALGPGYYGNAFAGESLRNLVHRRLLASSGVTFLAKRGEEGKEFLASADPWFHPVYLATGPDGALYVVDFYRKFVEHPHWVPGEARSKVDWREGEQHGRIWRIRAGPASTGGEAKWPRLSETRTAELLSHFEVQNAWWRDTTQRLLIERQDREAAPRLGELARHAKAPAVRVQALWTLLGLGTLQDEQIVDALSDEDANVRGNAIRLAEGRLNSSEKLANALLPLTKDSSPRVRLQLALSLGEWRGEAKLGPLRRLAERTVGDRWQSLAVLSSLGERPWLFLKGMDQRWLKEPSDTQAQFVARVVTLSGAASNEGDLADCLDWLATLDVELTQRMVFLANLAEGLDQSNRRLGQLLRQPPPWLAQRVAMVNELIHQALKTAAEDQAKLPLRLAAIRLLGKLSPDVAGGALVELLLPMQPAEVQSAAAAALAKLDDAVLYQHAFVKWRQYAKATRTRLLASAARSPVAAPALLDALERNRLALVELDASARQSLQRIQDEGVKQRVQKLLEKISSPDREEVVARFQAAIHLPGERSQGAAIFARTCLACHLVGGRGKHVGPDLSSISSRSRETLLVDILDPSRTMSPDYVSYVLKTTAGDVLGGMIVAESSAGVTLRRPAEPDITIPRASIKDLRADGKSVMPDGLEQGLSLQDMADLLEFLSHPDAAMLPEDK